MIIKSKDREIEEMAPEREVREGIMLVLDGYIRDIEETRERVWYKLRDITNLLGHNAFSQYVDITDERFEDFKERFERLKEEGVFESCMLKNIPADLRRYVLPPTPTFEEASEIARKVEKWGRDDRDIKTGKVWYRGGISSYKKYHSASIEMLEHFEEEPVRYFLRVNIHPATPVGGPGCPVFENFGDSEEEQIKIKGLFELAQEKEGGESKR